MIKIEHTVFPSPDQMEFIVEGMRNPMNSWDKSDSCIIGGYDGEEGIFDLGKDDKRLMLKLAKSGTDHRKYMRMMQVYIRITAPLYWWKEADTYMVGVVKNSCSTMHKIAEKEFTCEDFSKEHLKRIGHYVDNNVSLIISPAVALENIIINLNCLRNRYLETKSKDDWYQMIQLLPSSYNQTRNIMLNYEVLSNIYKSRKNHKLDEWRDFCKWIETIPMHELIMEAI